MYYPLHTQLIFGEGSSSSPGKKKENAKTPQIHQHLLVLLLIQNSNKSLASPANSNALSSALQISIILLLCANRKFKLL